MNILKNIFKRAKPSAPTPIAFNYNSLITALNDSNPTVLFCENLIANSISSLPIELYFRKNDDERIIPYSHSIRKIVTKRPNLNEPTSVFYSSLVKHILRYGNAFIYKLKNSEGQISQLILINPSSVTIQTKGLFKEYLINGNIFTNDDIIHIPSLYGYDGVKGKSVLEYARETISNSNKIASYVSAYYDNNVNTRIKITAGKENPTDEELKELVDFYSNSGGKLNSGMPLVEYDGNKIDALNLPNQSNELIASREFEERMICQFFSVPYALLQNKDTNGVVFEQINLFFKANCLVSLTDRIEEYFSLGLLSEYESERYYFQFDYDEFLRPDAKTRNEIITNNLKLGLISPNEARKEYNFPSYQNDIAGDIPIRDGVGPLTRDVIDAYAAGAKLKLLQVQEKQITDGPEQNKDNKSK